MSTRLSAYSDAELRRIEDKIIDRIERDCGGPRNLADAWLAAPHKTGMCRRLQRVRMERARNARQAAQSAAHTGTTSATPRADEAREE